MVEFVVGLLAISVLHQVLSSTSGRRHSGGALAIFFLCGKKVKRKKKKKKKKILMNNVASRSIAIGERTFANCGKLWHFLLTKIINNTWSRPITHC
jgi:hypothetical protein